MTEFEINTPFRILLDKAENYSITSIELLKLKTIQHVSDVLSTIISKSIVLVFFGVFILFCTVALAIWLGHILYKPYIGFLIIGIVYGLIGLLFYFFHAKWLKLPLQNFFIANLKNKTHEK